MSETDLEKGREQVRSIGSTTATMRIKARYGLYRRAMAREGDGYEWLRDMLDALGLAGTYEEDKAKAIVEEAELAKLRARP